MYFHKPQEKPRKWGSFQDVQHAIRKNAEKIYQIDPDSMVLCMPLFWGLPPLDYSGKNNNGINYGPTYKDRSLYFDGDNDYIDCGDVNNDIDVDSGTISAWIKIYSMSDSGVVFSAKVDSNNNIALFWNDPENTFNFKYKAEGIVDQVQSATITETDNNWHHVILTWDTASDKVKAYIDGVQDGSTQVGLGTWVGSINQYVSIGSTGTSVHDYNFDGLISDVRISNIVLTADQIALFHDLPWALYQPVSRPVYFFFGTGDEGFTPKIIMF